MEQIVEKLFHLLCNFNLMGQVFFTHPTLAYAFQGDKSSEGILFI
jgi:hypothetical protein